MRIGKVIDIIKARNEVKSVSLDKDEALLVDDFDFGEQKTLSIDENVETVTVEVGDNVKNFEFGEISHMDALLFAPQNLPNKYDMDLKFYILNLMLLSYQDDNMQWVIKEITILAIFSLNC